MSDVTLLLVCLTGLQVKHFLADFCLQNAYMLNNKGRYGHPGGLLHAGVHMGLSALVLLPFVPDPAVLAGVVLAEGLVHYHIDVLKDVVTRKGALRSDQPRFWMAFGADQLAHQLTMLAMVFALFGFGSA